MIVGGLLLNMDKLLMSILPLYLIINDAEKNKYILKKVVINSSSHASNERLTI